MTRKSASVLLLLLTLTAAGIAGAVFYLYNKPQRAVAGEAPALRLPAQELFDRYSEQENQANELYLDKVLEVTGTIGEISTGAGGETTLILKNERDMFGVSCTLDGSQGASVSQLRVGETVKVKGLCTGMLMDVVLIRCVLLE